MSTEIIGLEEHTFNESFLSVAAFGESTPWRTLWYLPFSPPDWTASLPDQARGVEIARLADITTLSGQPVPRSLHTTYNMPGTFTYEHWTLARPDEITTQDVERRSLKYTAPPRALRPPTTNHRLVTPPAVCETYGRLATRDNHLAVVTDYLRAWCNRHEVVDRKDSMAVGRAVGACIMRSAAILNFEDESPPARFLHALGGDFGPFQAKVSSVIANTMLRLKDEASTIWPRRQSSSQSLSKLAGTVISAFTGAGLIMPAKNKERAGPKPKLEPEASVSAPTPTPAPGVIVTPRSPKPPELSAEAVLGSHVLARLPVVARALRRNKLQELMRENDQRAHKKYLDRHLDVLELGHFMEGFFADWRQQGFLPTNFKANLSKSKRFSANTPAQLVAIAAEAGAIECPPLALTKPYHFNDFETTVIGLLRLGLEAKDMAEAFSIPRLSDLTVPLFNTLTDRLPAREPRPPFQNAPWLVYTARRLGLFAFTLDQAEHFDANTLSSHMATLFQEGWRFQVPKTLRASSDE